MNISIDDKSKLFKSPDVYIKDTGTQKGRGIFAAKNFSPGDIVEECPVVLFKAPFVPLDEMKRVIFSWLALTKGRDENTFALALGCGSMYNHNNPANMKYEANVTDKTLKFIATREITINEELTINYNALSGNTESSDDNWFNRMKEPLIKNDKQTILDGCDSKLCAVSCGKFFPFKRLPVIYPTMVSAGEP